MSEIKEVAYLGPKGTYSHIIAKKHFGENVKLIPMPSIIDICLFAEKSETRRGIVPVENSSGGPIAETLDVLIYNKCKLAIEESLRLNIKLALLGKQNKEIKKVYSHSIPLYHCKSWVRAKYPSAAKVTVSSTAEAARQASKDENSSAIASINSAELYGLDVLVYPIEQEVANLTQFYSLCLKPSTPLRGKVKTSIAAFLKDEPGSLYDFLEPFKTDKVNMSRIISRPIYGKPSEYAFYVDVDGNLDDPQLKITIKKIAKACATCRIISSYPENRIYNL